MDGLHIYPTLVSAALIEVGRQGGFYSHNLHPPSGTAGICPLLGLFSFARCVIQHLRLSENSLGLCSLLEVSCLSWVCPEFYGGGSEDVGELVWYFFAIWPDWFVQSLLRGIYSCRLAASIFPPCCTFGGLVGDQCLWKSSPYLLVFLSRDVEGLDGISPLISDGISFVAVFPHSVRRRELNRFKRRMLVVVLFGLITTDLSCHIVTL